ncbi:MAG: hypothetical protein HC897_05830 [Thermoanaerobaculia bacterium]|nr:hypothetical protein [Thermoanaerobaculia bacterium]
MNVKEICSGTESSTQTPDRAVPRDGTGGPPSQGGGGPKTDGSLPVFSEDEPVTAEPATAANQ